MDQNNRQLDSFGVPKWIGESCDQHRIIHLSDTRTYRLLLVIFRAIIDGSTTLNNSKVVQEEKMLSFMSWFLKLGSSMPAYPGLMWLYQELGQKAMATQNQGQLADDKRLALMLMTFIVLSDTGENDPLTERYYHLIGEGWEHCGQGHYKESLYQGLKATLTTQAYRELVAIGKERDFPESETKKSLLHLAGKARAEQQHEFNH